MKTLLILLLFTMTAYSAPPDHANNPDGDDMPDQANCIFCDDDEPEPEPEPDPATPFCYDLFSGIITIAGYELAKYAINKLRTKKHS